MAITDLDDYTNRITEGNSGTPESIFFYKARYVAGAAFSSAPTTRLTSAWLQSGVPGPGAAPGGSVRIPDNTTNGGLKQANPGGGRSKYLLGGGVGCATSTGGFSVNSGGGILVYDRLLDISGFNGTTLTAQTVGGSITRYTDGVGNIAFVEVYTAIGGTTTNITMSYTDQDGNAGVTSSGGTVIGNAGYQEKGRMIPIVLATGDVGVRAVASVTLAGTTATAGDFGVTIGHPLMWIPAGATEISPGGYRNLLWSLLAEVKTNACLALAYIPTAANSQELYGNVQMIEA